LLLAAIQSLLNQRVCSFNSGNVYSTFLVRVAKRHQLEEPAFYSGGRKDAFAPSQTGTNVEWKSLGSARCTQVVVAEKRTRNGIKMHLSCRKEKQDFPPHTPGPLGCSSQDKICDIKCASQEALRHEVNSAVGICDDKMPVGDSCNSKGIRRGTLRYQLNSAGEGCVNNFSLAAMSPAIVRMCSLTDDEPCVLRVCSFRQNPWSRGSRPDPLATCRHLFAVSETSIRGSYSK
jgi:hypothetical protein